MKVRQPVSDRAVLETGFYADLEHECCTPCRSLISSTLQYILEIFPSGHFRNESLGKRTYKTVAQRP